MASTLGIGPIDVLMETQRMRERQQDRQPDLLNTLLQGIETGAKLENFPEQLRQQRLAQQVALELQQAALAKAQRPQTFEVGNALLRENPETGQLETIYQAPPTDTIGNRLAIEKGLLEMREPFEIAKLERETIFKGLANDKDLQNKYSTLQEQNRLAIERGDIESQRDLSNKLTLVQEEAKLKAAKPDKALTEMQARTNVSAQQAANAQSKLEKLENVDPAWFTPGIPFLDFPERLKSAERKQFEQAAEEFTEAALRFKTGASITKDETRRSIGIWIRQPGDDATTIANKKASRDLIIREMAVASGRPINASTAPPSDETVIPPGMKLQRNTKTGATRLVPK